jgi:pyruvate dehydrogenase E1 component alpha subunit
MPRKTLDLPESVEYLSVLDEEGNVDEELLPDLPEDLLKRMLRSMLRGRFFDEKRLQLQRQGRIGTFAPGRGQEASQIGAVAALSDEDWVVPSFRETTASLWRGVPLSGVLLFDAGYNEGGRIPEEVNDLPVAVPVGSQIPQAVGLAYGLRFRGDDESPVVLTFFGDGATSEGDFHEGMNLASLLEAPLVLLCQNNQWAISVPVEKQTRSKTLVQKALSYGMPGIQVDGNDILAVYSAVAEAVQRARDGGGPTLVECVTYRMSLHTTADDPTRYRSEEEVEEWEDRDPIQRFRQYLEAGGIVDEDEVESIEEELEKEVDAAWDQAQEEMEKLGGPETIFDHIYAERPAYLEEQRKAFLKKRSPEKTSHE